jgi:predicted transcriptional regulator
LPRKKISDTALTPLELQIMNVLWETGPAGVQKVQACLTGRELAYTTVQTMLNVLHRKGKVKRLLKDRAYIYRPVLSRKKAVTQAVGDMLDRFFGGSADGLLLNLVETNQLTPEKLARIQQIIDRPNSERPNSDRPNSERPKEKTHGND